MGRSRLDPVSWFTDLALALLFVAVGLGVAAHMVAQFWPWLLALIAGVIGLFLLGRLLVVLWRGWRQPW